MAEGWNLGGWAEFTLPPVENDAELEEIYLHDRFHKRDFWEDHFNLKILQQILDVHFNTIPGEYEARKDHYEIKTRLKVYCHVCRLELKGYDPFMSHNNGKAHKKMRQNHLILKQEVVNDDLEASTPQAIACKGIVKRTSVKDLQLRDLSEPRFTFPNGSLEQSIDLDPYPVVGVSYVMKEKDFDGEKFSCKLCKVLGISQNKMLEHLRSKQHAIKFFRVVKNRKVRESDVLRESEQMVSCVGRVNHSIPTFCKPSRIPWRLFSSPGTSKSSMEGGRVMVASGANLAPLGAPKSSNSLKAVAKMTKSDAANQTDSLDTLLESFNFNDLKKNVREIANDGHCWSLMVEALFSITGIAHSFADQNNDDETTYHLNRIYDQLTKLYRVENCYLPK